MSDSPILIHWRDLLERRQIPLYLGAVLAGLAVALGASNAGRLAPAIEPALFLMLYATFLQVPMRALGAVLSARRFVFALLLVQFAAVPLLVAALLPWLPEAPWLRAGVALVLLAPCIDYVVTFAMLGRGDARLLLAATPLLLAAQMLLLPIQVPWLAGSGVFEAMQAAPFLRAFATLIAAPLGLAWLTQRWLARAGEKRPRLALSLGLLPVPATALVLFLVAAAMLPALLPVRHEIWPAVPVYVAYAVLAPPLGWWIARWLGLTAPAARAVAFSAGTRNSLVVLPITLAVPGGLPLLPAVIVLQTLVELLFELVYVRVIARWGGRETA